MDTIDKSLERLQEIQNIMDFEINFMKDPDEKAWSRENVESIGTAIDTMRKYQQIEQIYLKWNHNHNISTSDAWVELIGVLENGNNN